MRKALEMIEDPSQKAKHMDLIASDVESMPRRRRDTWYNLMLMASSLKPKEFICDWPRTECLKIACSAAHL
jgi:hypothetical protein